MKEKDAPQSQPHAVAWPLASHRWSLVRSRPWVLCMQLSAPQAGEEKDVATILGISFVARHAFADVDKYPSKGTKQYVVGTAPGRCMLHSIHSLMRQCATYIVIYMVYQHNRRLLRSHICIAS